MARKYQEDNPYKGVINMRRIPILPLDNRWHMLFPQEQKSSLIKRLENDVMTIMKKQSGNTSEIKNLTNLKKKLLSEIMNNMEEVSNPKQESLRLKKLEKSRKLVGDIDIKIEKIEMENEVLPDKLIKANEALLLATIEDCYDRIHRNEQQIEVLGQWIDKTREELKKNLIIKQEKEEMNQNIYTYMHDIFGHEFMEVFDKRNMLE